MPKSSRAWYTLIALLTLAGTAAVHTVLTYLDRSLLREQQQHRIEFLQHDIDKTVSKFDLAARSIARLPRLKWDDPQRLPFDEPTILLILTSIKRLYNASSIYLMDRTGTVRICTRYPDGTTFTGKNFSFRPYFRNAMAGRSGRFAGVGVVTFERGIYYSAPLYTAGNGDRPAGVIVIKMLLDPIDRLIKKSGIPAALLSPDGIVFSSSRPEWLFHAALPLSEEKRRSLLASKQFSNAPLLPLRTLLNGRKADFGEGIRYDIIRLPLRMAGWTLLSLHRETRYFPVYLYAIAVIIIIGIGALSAHIHTLQQRKRNITLQREFARSQLQEKEKQYRQIFNSTTDGLLILDYPGRIQELNPQAACFIYTEATRKNSLPCASEEIRAELRGMPAGDLIAPMHPRLFRDFLKKAVVEGFASEEFTIHTEDGAMRLLQCMATPFSSEGNELLLLTIHDVTETRKSEQKIEYHRKHLKLINRILRHDLSNGLTIILASLDNEALDPDPDNLVKARQGVKRCVDIIHQMREFESFIEQHSNLFSIDIRKVINRITDTLTTQHPEITFAVDGEAAVMADMTVASVFENLIRNAIQHSGCRKVDIRIETGESFAVIRIMDRGNGVEDRLKERIFEENFRHGEKSNTGLGLYIVKTAVENMGGSISVKDNRPQGAVFEVILHRDMKG